MAKYRLLLAIVVALSVVAPRPAMAHAGPPYVVLQDARVGPYTLTLWADPDIGTGSFLVEPGDAGTGQPQTVVVRLRPVDGHRAEVGAPATPQRNDDELVFVARVPLDAGGRWSGVIEAVGTAGRGEAAFEVEVTPPYPEWLETLPCLLPFVVVGVLWWIGARVRPAPRADRST